MTAFDYAAGGGDQVGADPGLLEQQRRSRQCDQIRDQREQHIEHAIDDIDIEAVPDDHLEQ